MKTPAGKLEIQETFVNRDNDTRYGETHWYEPFTDDLGSLYRSLQREYGRCTSKVYIDKKDGTTHAIGWTFTKRVEYDDNPRKTYLREVWVTRRYVQVDAA